METVAFEDIWKEMDKEYLWKEGAYEAYLKVFNQLKELTAETNHDNLKLAVVKVEDEFHTGAFNYEVFGVKTDDKERYGLELTPWRKWLSLEVLDKCIAAYGAEVVVAHFLYSLTFFGYDADEVESRIEKEIAILKEHCEEIENGTAEYIPWEEVRKRLHS
ncbi:DUF6557 family protein [Desulfitobacterium sp. AusDCA]|uniref:DUF6557 family protein n=1 Tax=Desulfitobacterium sp. AusDCA TaxID=3240383 RepID=UPI003DA71032